MANEETPQETLSATAGHQLRAAREKRGLTVARVAEVLHLRPAIIDAIENSNFRQIDTELFLKGYVRSYAAQVGLDADRLIARLDQELEPLREEKVRAQEAHPLVDIQRRKRRKRQIARVVLLILVLALLGYFGVRWLDRGAVLPGQSSEVQPPAESGADAAESGSDSPNESAPVTTEPLSQAESPAPEPPAAETSAPQPATTDSATDAEVVDSGAGEPSALIGVEEVPPVSGEGEAAADFEQNGASEATVAAPVVTESVEPALAEEVEADLGTTQASLEMSFVADCWVRITDANGDRLASSLQRAGDRLAVTGAAPLRLVIGAVDAVGAITFDGEPVDLGDVRVVNNRAEFSLDR